MATNGQRLLHKHMQQVLLAMALCSICLLLNWIHWGLPQALLALAPLTTVLTLISGIIALLIWQVSNIIHLANVKHNLSKKWYHQFGQHQVSSIWLVSSIIHLAGFKQHSFGQNRLLHFTPPAITFIGAYANYHEWHLCWLLLLMPTPNVAVDVYIDYYHWRHHKLLLSPPIIVDTSTGYFRWHLHRLLSLTPPLIIIVDTSTNYFSKTPPL